TELFELQTQLVTFVPLGVPNIVNHDQRHKDAGDKSCPSSTCQAECRKAQVSINHHPVQKHIDDVTTNDNKHRLFGLGQALRKLPEGLKDHKRQQGKSNDTQIWNSKIHYFGGLIEVI